MLWTGSNLSLHPVQQHPASMNPTDRQTRTDRKHTSACATYIQQTASAQSQHTVITQSAYTQYAQSVLTVLATGTACTELMIAHCVQLKAVQSQTKCENQVIHNQSLKQQSSSHIPHAQWALNWQMMPCLVASACFSCVSASASSVVWNQTYIRVHWLGTQSHKQLNKDGLCEEKRVKIKSCHFSRQHKQARAIASASDGSKMVMNAYHRYS